MYDAFMWFGLGVVFGLLCYLLAVIHSENKKRKENELMWKIRDEVLDSSRFEDMEVRSEVCENKYKRLDNRISSIYDSITHDLDYLRGEIAQTESQIFNSVSLVYFRKELGKIYNDLQKIKDELK